MFRILCLASLTLVTLAVATALPVAAEAEELRSPPILLSAMAGAQVEVPSDHLVVFQNDAAATTRVVFRKRDIDGVSCQEGAGVERSRRGQYTVRSGAELLCTLEEGSYRYETLTQARGGIERHSSRLSVR